MFDPRSARALKAGEPLIVKQALGLRLEPLLARGRRNPRSSWGRFERGNGALAYLGRSVKPRAHP